MKTLPSIPEDPFAENLHNEAKEKQDAFEKQIDKHNRAKTHQILNLIYSVLVGVLSGVLTKRHFKHSKTIGLVLALGSFLIGKKASQDSTF